MKRLIRRIKYLLLDLCDGAFAAVVPYRPAGGRPKVAFIRLDAIGDLALWLEGASRLAAYYHDRGFDVHFICSRVCADLAKKMSFFDRVMVIDRGRFDQDIRHRMRMFLEIRREGYACVIHPVYGREYFFGDALVRASGARERIGIDGDAPACRMALKKVSDTFYTRLLTLRSGQFDHELEKSAEVVALVTGARSPVRMFDLRPLLAAGPENGKYFLVCPGANWDGRRWPADRFLDVAGRIHAKTGWPCVVAGTAREAQACDTFRRASFPVTFRMEMDLITYAACVAGARLVLCNDSSPVHLAAACRVPAVAVSSGMHLGKVLPYPESLGPDRGGVRAVFKKLECCHCEPRCRYPQPKGEPVTCVSSVTVDDVWREVQDLLSVRG